MRPSIDAAELALEGFLRTEYLVLRRLPDGSYAGLQRLLYTTGLFMGVDRNGWSKRFCFKDVGEALAQLALLKSEDDEPEGFVARRPDLRDKDGHYLGAQGVPHDPR